MTQLAESRDFSNWHVGEDIAASLQRCLRYFDEVLTHGTSGGGDGPDDIGQDDLLKGESLAVVVPPPGAKKGMSVVVLGVPKPLKSAAQLDLIRGLVESGEFGLSIVLDLSAEEAVTLFDVLVLASAAQRVATGPTSSALTPASLLRRVRLVDGVRRRLSVALGAEQ